METFIFNLNKNTKYKKLKNYASLYCSSSYGMYTYGLGNSNSIKEMTHFAYEINSYYENASEILPSNGKTKNYNLLEVEVFKISLI